MKNTYVQGKDGRMKGSIGTGKTDVPTPASHRLPTPPEAEEPDQVSSLLAMHARMKAQDDPETDFLFDSFMARFTASGVSSNERNRLFVSHRKALVEHFAANPDDESRFTDWVDRAGFGVLQPSTRTAVGALGRQVQAHRNAQEDAEEDRKREEKRALKEERARATRERRSLKGADPSLMTPSSPNGIPFESSVASHPQLAAEWDPANPCPPEEISLSSNGAAWFRCPKCNTQWKSTVDNRTKAFRKSGGGLRINCPACHGRRKRSMEHTQECLTAYHEHLQGNSEAWDTLPEALRYSLMAEAGAMRGSEETFGTAIAMGNLRGDYSLSDIIAATDVDVFADRVDESLGESDVISDIDVTGFASDEGEQPSRSSSTDPVDTILASSSVAGAVDNEALVNQIMRTNVERLWNEIYDRTNESDSILEQVKAAQTNGDAYQQRVAQEFLDEYEAVMSMPIPDDFATEQIRNGKHTSMDPLPSQRRFAYLVAQQRVLANWSGTGAGKTLSAALAARAIDAQETVVFCPKGVKEQWIAELDASFPGVYQVREDLPKDGEDLDATGSGQPRVWIINYDALSQDHRKKATQLGALTDRVDMVVLDEAHLVKQSVPTGKSLRRGVLEKFTDESRAASPDLAVVMQTATPVKNNLEEAKSLLRILHGPDGSTARIRTEPTARNAAAVYTHLSEAGVRWKPAYEQNLHRNEITVDITAKTRHVADEVRRLQGDSTTVHPSVMERALLPEKLPTIVDRVRAADGPVVVYSHYVKGMIDPISERLTNEGLRVRKYTGNLSGPDRAELIRDFQNGDFDVLVGSSPLGTGIDGLQRVSNHMIVVSPPWTAADDDQLVGRMQRPGQHRDVTIDYIITEAKAGEAEWSYDRDNRINRIKFKKSLADAAVDGVLAEGITHEERNVASALTALETMSDVLTADVSH